MIRKRLKCALGVAIPLAILVIGIGYNSYVKIHTFTLSGDEIVKTEQIQPITGSVKVTGNTDTDVVFTDIEMWRNLYNRLHYFWNRRYN